MVVLQPVSLGALHVKSGVSSVVFVPAAGLNEPGAAGAELSVLIETFLSVLVPAEVQLSTILPNIVCEAVSVQ